MEGKPEHPHLHQFNSTDFTEVIPDLRHYK